jgi:hypothetical protein
MTLVGLAVYKLYFFSTNFRSIYIFTTCFGVLFSILQLLLIYRVNQSIGIPDVIFALGDNTFFQFTMALQYMPSCILFVVLCPEGSEGTTYALLTTVTNLGGTVAADFGSWMTKIWNVSNSAFEAGHFSGMAKLTFLTSCLQLVPIFLVAYLPASKVGCCEGYFYRLVLNKTCLIYINTPHFIIHNII